MWLKSRSVVASHICFLQHINLFCLKLKQPSRISMAEGEQSPESPGSPENPVEEVQTNPEQSDEATNPVAEKLADQIASELAAPPPPPVEETNAKINVPEEEKIIKLSAYGLGWRHVHTALGFWGFFCIYTLRVNLSIAMVAMVKHIPKNDTDNHTSKCFTIDANSTKTKESGEFEWSEEMQGVVLGAFFYGYVTTQIPGGLYASKHGGKWIFGLGTFWTALLTLLSPIAAEQSAAALIAVRVLEGIGEGCTWPAMHAMFSRWAPPSERSKLPALTYSGCYVGTVVAFATSGFLVESGFLGGWPSLFYVYGTIGCIWFAFWAFLGSDGPENHRYISAAEKEYILESQKLEGKREYPAFCDMPWKKLATSLPVWALVLSHFSHNWGFYTLLTQLPKYLKSILGFDIKQNGYTSALPYFCMALVQMMTGMVAEKVRVKLNMKTVHLRKACDCVGHIIPGICLLSVTLINCDSTATVALLTVAVGLSGLTGAGCFVNHLDIAPKYSGLLFGISNSVASIPGIAGPYVVGIITSKDQTESAWAFVFYIAAFIYFSSAIFFAIFGAGEVQEWAKSPVVTSAPEPVKPIIQEAGEVAVE